MDDEVRYDVLIQNPEVRVAIQRHAAMAKKGMSGEDFLKLCDSLILPGVPLSLLASVFQPLYAKAGIKTGKQRVEQVDAPTGKVIVRALCSLAKHAQQLRRVTQATDGCGLEAVLASDMWSFEGELLIGLRRQGPSTEVTGRTIIKGQLYDWGKSKRCLKRLFADLRGGSE